MKRKNVLGWLLAAGLPVILAACGSDDPPPKAGVAFEKADEEVTESDGTPASFHPEAADYVGLSSGVGRELTVKLILDKELASDAVIAYTVTGTATSVNPSDDGDVNDFTLQLTGDKLTLDSKQITIAKGAKEALFKITVYEDLILEYDKNVLNASNLSYETIILTLTSVVSGPIELGTQTSYTMKILEDDAIFFLDWAIDGGNTQGDVNMDLLFLADGTPVWGSVSDDEYEATNFPAGFPDGTYGVAYTYYAGTSDDVDFAAGLWNTYSTINGKSYLWPNADPLVFDGHLTKKNINKWRDANAPDPVSVQTFNKNGFKLTDVSTISVADTLSRTSQPVFLKAPAQVSQYLGKLHGTRIKTAPWQ